MRDIGRLAVFFGFVFAFTEERAQWLKLRD